MMGLRYILPLLLVAVLPLVYGYALPQSEILIDSDEGEDFDDLWQHDHRDNRRKKEFHCPFPYGQYADPYDCAQYYVCKFGVPHSMKCSRNKLYDAKRQQCRDKRDVTCKRKDSKEDSSSEEDSHEERNKGVLECPYIWGTYAHPIDCSRYYVCNYKMPSVFQCRDNELFDDRERKCRDKRRVKCGNRLDRDQMKTSRKPRVTTTTTRKPTTTKPTKTTTKSAKTTTTRKGTTTSRRPQTTTTVRPETTTRIKTTTEITTTTKKSYFCPFHDGRFVDSKDCSRFYSCMYFIPILNFCPKNTLYDERKEECREAKKVKCNGRPRGPNDDYEGDKEEKQENFKCPYVWGTFTHPVDCSKYIVCVYNVPTVFTCRKTELFEPKYRRCIASDKVDCTGRINPDDPITTLIPTTTPTTPIPTTTTTTPIPTTTTTTPIPTTTTTTPIPTTTTPIPTTTTTTPIPTTSTTTPIPTTTTTTPIPTTTTTTPIPTTTTTTPIPTTTTTTPIPTTTTTTPIPTTTPTTTTVKPNIPPPTDCDDDDPDCIMEETKDVDKWFKCPERYGHYPHGSSVHLFVHCDNWRPFIKKCAEGTKFHPEYMVCVWVGQ